MEAFRVYVHDELGEEDLLWQTLHRIRRAEDLDRRKADAIALLEARVRPPECAPEPGHPRATPRKPQAEVQRAKVATITTDFTPKERNLYAACVAFDTRTFNRLLNTGGIDVNKCGEFGTMLVMASFMGQSISVRKLLATPGIDPNLAFSNGATPLFCAAQFGHNDVVRRLLAERRVNVNLATSENVTPLFIAAAEGHTEAVKLLLSAPDINVNAATQNNETPLYVAADLGFLDIVDLLLDAPKIDLEQRAGGESTPLFIAAQNNHWEIVDRLRRRGAYVNSAIGNGSTPLHIAASNGHGRVVKMLLRAPDIALDQPWMGGGHTPDACRRTRA